VFNNIPYLSHLSTDGVVDDDIAVSVQINVHARTLLTISNDLSQVLPDKSKFAPEIEKVALGTEQVIVEFQKVQNPANRPADLQRYVDMVDHLGADSLNTYFAAGKAYSDVYEDARALKEKREKIYNIAKWSSYFLFAIGWGIAFYGQLSGKDDKPTMGEG
jgi:hypothetical protein